MTGMLQAHSFPPALPNASKARLLREVRLVCTPYAGCDAYMMLPTSVQMPPIEINSASGEKSVQIELQAAPQ